MKPAPSTRKRSITKALTWESFSTTVCFGIAYVMFGNVGCCAVFAAICFIVKLILFYGHERIWHQIPYGKIQPLVLNTPTNNRLLELADRYPPPPEWYTEPDIT